MNGDSERAVRGRLGYRPWRCNRCSVQFLSLQDARLHYQAPYSRHPGQRFDVTEALDPQKELQVYLRAHSPSPDHTFGHGHELHSNLQPNPHHSLPRARPPMNPFEPHDGPQPLDLSPPRLLDQPQDEAPALEDIQANSFTSFFNLNVSFPGQEELVRTSNEDELVRTSNEEELARTSQQPAAAVVIVDLAGQEEREEAKAQLRALDDAGLGLRAAAQDLGPRPSKSADERISAPLVGGAQASVAASAMAVASLSGGVVDVETVDGAGETMGRVGDQAMDDAETEDGAETEDKAAKDPGVPGVRKAKPRSKAQRLTKRKAGEAKGEAAGASEGGVVRGRGRPRKDGASACGECGELVGTWPSHRRRHVAQKHNDEAVLLCPVCPYATKNTLGRSTVVRHMGTQHPGQPLGPVDRRALHKDRLDRLVARCFP